MKIGDRVVDKTNGKHGTVIAIFTPIQFGYKNKVKAKIDCGGGNFDVNDVHNFCEEDKWVKPVNRTWETEDLVKEGADIKELTPLASEPAEQPKPKKSRKPKAKATEESNEDAIADIVGASEA